MDYYCDVCDKTIKIKSKSKHLKSILHNEFDKCIRTKHTNENPDYFGIDKLLEEYITNHNKKFHLYLVKYDFKSFFDGEFYPHIKSDFQYNNNFSFEKIFIKLD